MYQRHFITPAQCTRVFALGFMVAVVYINLDNYELRRVKAKTPEGFELSLYVGIYLQLLMQ